MNEDAKEVLSILSWIAMLVFCIVGAYNLDMGIAQRSFIAIALTALWTMVFKLVNNN